MTPGDAGWQPEVAPRDLYGHRGRGGVWQPGLGPCICAVCVEESRAAREREKEGT